MLYTFEDRVPELRGDNHYIADNVIIIGSVIIHNNVSILPNVVIRADNDIITIGENSNIQDGAILHTDPGIPMKIGNSVTVAHKTMLHGCTIGDNTVIGIGAVVLNNAVIGKNCMVGANTLILEKQEIPDGSLVLGSPGQIKRSLLPKEIEEMQSFSRHYVEKIKRYNNSLKIYNPV